MKGRLFQRVLVSQREFSLARSTAALVFNVRLVGTREIRRSLLDTFDQRLRRAGRWLELDRDNAVQLRLRGTGSEVDYVEQMLVALPAQPVKVPEGPVAAVLQPLLGGRALLVRGELLVRVTDYLLEDNDGKIHARLAREQMPRSLAGPALTSLRLWPLRGYEKSSRRLWGDMESVLKCASVETDPAQAWPTLSGGMDTPAPINAPIPLRPRQSATRASGLILLGQLRIIESNVNGILGDTDTEFLHDFRIACRRSRSLLTQVRGAFPAQGLAPHRETFSWLSRVTSPQRDLDVFLATLPDLSARLSGRHTRALEPLHDLLTQRRAVEHERLVQALTSARFRDFLPAWRQYLEGFAGARAPRKLASPYALDAASGTLKRLYRRLLRDGVRCGIGAYSPVLHELRKDGKKLRYLLEAFRSLYPQPEVDEVVRRLRKLQGVLGQIVDYHVQRDWLLQWHQDYLSQRDAHSETLTAMTALGSLLDRLELEAQRDFARRFEQFAAAPVQSALDRLLEYRP